MKRKSIFAIFTLFLSLSFVLAACGGTEEESKSEENGGQEGGTAEETEQAENVTVEHAMGETEVPAEPKRVVILTNEGTEALLSMDVTPAGAVQSWTGDPWYDHIKDQMKDVENVGTESQVNLEAIAKLEPDLIIGNKMRQEEIYPQLEAIAPTVFAETLRGNWKENFELYSKAVNKEEKGQQVLDDYQARIENIREEAGENLKKEVSIVRFMPGDARIYHKDSFSGVILEEIGFARPESQDKEDFAEKNATKERIPAMDGDVIFYFTYETGDGEGLANEKEWVNDPLWQNLSAVQEGNVHKVDDAIWNTAGGVIAANLMLDDVEKYLVE
ncbi:ABC transporter substrate-binding protein [Bacillus marinisedimentorum]|uniref:ABC transporter substrate-binding protein n=1 Tax=Bacillus marinisedimentorum TaxID=1821260 RepID=UPI0007E00FF2|nr:iron-siderophore ABC transporter substrate-binding protein [Bacillus marinisedimentorum]